MTDLVVRYTGSCRWRVAWSEGGFLGNLVFSENDLAEAQATGDQETVEVIAANLEVGLVIDGKERDGEGWYWRSCAGAVLALGHACGAVERVRGQWPSWALMAAQSGWIPPEGWAP